MYGSRILSPLISEQGRPAFATPELPVVALKKDNRAICESVMPKEKLETKT